MLKCPYCKFESDECDFPDFVFCKSKEQEKMLETLQEALQENMIRIVTCEKCGSLMLKKLKAYCEECEHLYVSELRCYDHTFFDRCCATTAVRYYGVDRRPPRELNRNNDCELFIQKRK